MVVTTVEQYQFRDDGIVLNTDASLPFVDITGVQGLDTAGYRTTTKEVEGIDGGTLEANFETPRTVVIDGIAYASPTALDAYLDHLGATCDPNAADDPYYCESTT